MKKILVVDDDFSILEALKVGIESEGYEVMAISDGEKTYESVKKFNPNLILLDYLLSGKDGQEIVRELKSKRETKNIPVIMLSAHPSADKCAQECGADGFIPKPFEFDHLLEVIEKH